MTVPLELDIIELVKKGSLAEAQRRIATLLATVDALHSERGALKRRVVALEDEIRLRDTLSFDGQFYWTGSGENRQGPYCPNCFDRERQLQRLQFRTIEEIDYDTGDTRPGAQVFYKCNRCSGKTIRDAKRA